jgi:uncharacterized protein YdeI (YjbR/CyaY-like superfamily)
MTAPHRVHFGIASRYKVRSGIASITPAQAIDAVLCWGWIDGIRKGLDDVSFLQRYTPRTKKSVWSKRRSRRRTGSR